MGVSSDGILFYGFCFTEEDDPWAPATEEERKKAKYGPDSLDWDEIYELRSGKSEKDAPVVCGFHCSFEFSMKFVAIRESLVRAFRGDPQKVTNTQVKEEWKAQLEEFCTIMGIDPAMSRDVEPAWWVTSLYG